MESLSDRTRFIQEKSPDGGFLQSEEWRKFQEAVGKKTYHIESLGGGAPKSDFWANIVEHKLPIVGKYFYVPRGPVASIDANFQFPISNFQNFLADIIDLAKKENSGWIRIEPNNKKFIEIYRNLLKLKIVKAPHDMQPREILVLDITKSEEKLLAEMKAKTRYNIRLSQKHNISVKIISNFSAKGGSASGGQFLPPQRDPARAATISNKIPNSNERNSKFYIDEFIGLVKITAKRDNITPHPENYYRKMFEVMPSNILKLYVAEYDNKIIAANIAIFYGNTATYLHGASDYNYRNAMAPYLLQWQAILDAKKAGCTKYDMGGIKISNFQIPISNEIPNPKSQILNSTSDSWHGITRFKTGFAPNTKPIEFLGSYDIVLSPFKYNLYRILQRVKSFI